MSRNLDSSSCYFACTRWKVSCPKTIFQGEKKRQQVKSGEPGEARGKRKVITITDLNVPQGHLKPSSRDVTHMPFLSLGSETARPEVLQKSQYLPRLGNNAQCSDNPV